MTNVRPHTMSRTKKRTVNAVGNLKLFFGLSGGASGGAVSVAMWLSHW